MKVCAKLCKECPFSNTSTRGWLGAGLTPDMYMTAQQYDYPVTCHLHREEGNTEVDVLAGKIPVCRGFLLSATKSYKLFGQAGTPVSKALHELQTSTDFAEGERETVLSRQEFTAYHTISFGKSEPFS